MSQHQQHQQHQQKQQKQKKQHNDDKITNATLSLIECIGSPHSSLPLARRIMSSTIGSSSSSLSRSHYYNTPQRIFKRIQRSYRKYLIEQHHQQQVAASNNDGDNGLSPITTDDPFLLTEIDKKVARVMNHVNILSSRLKHTTMSEEMSLNVLILLSQLVGRKGDNPPPSSSSTTISEIPPSPIMTSDYDEINTNSPQSLTPPIPPHSQHHATNKNENPFQNNQINQIRQKQQNQHNNDYSKINKNENPFQKNKSRYKQQNNQHLYQTLLRETIFSLQGISGESLRFFLPKSTDRPSRTTYSGIVIRPGSLPPNSHPALSDTIHLAGECGWLYTRLQSYISDVNDVNRGAVSRALSTVLSRELEEYLRLIAVLDNNNNNLEQQNNSNKNNGLDFARLVLHLRHPLQRLRTLTIVTDGVSELRGGQLASALHAHCHHGDLRHSSLVKCLIKDATRPWYRILYSWVQEGVLEDAHGEFFVVEDESIGGDELWDERYGLREDMVPTFIGNALAKMILSVGKGINFIRECLEDKHWTLSSLTTKSNAQNIINCGFQYGSDALLHSTVRQSAQDVNEHILKQLMHDFELVQHLLGLKGLLLLSQGDFVSALMEALYPELSQRASHVYIHNLQSILDGALRNTNARFMPPHVLDRLRVRLLKTRSSLVIMGGDGDHNQAAEEDDSSHKETGWDVFSLDYALSTPLTAIIHKSAIKKYRRIFHFLWKLKQIEYELATSWKEATILYHAISQENESNQTAPNPCAEQLLRQMAMTRQEMLLFATNIQSYLMFEVIEGGWEMLLKAMRDAKTLDELIMAHDMYLETILTKSLLHQHYDDYDDDVDNNDCRYGNDDNVTTNGNHHRHHNNKMSLPQQLMRVLDISSRFCAYQHELFTKSLSSLEESATKRNNVDSRIAKDGWGYFETDYVMEKEKQFHYLADEARLREVEELSCLFNEALRLLLKLLHDEVNAPDVHLTSSSSQMNGSSSKAAATASVWDDNHYEALRYLTFRLDFSDYYSNQGITTAATTTFLSSPSKEDGSDVDFTSDKFSNRDNQI